MGLWGKELSQLGQAGTCQWKARGGDRGPKPRKKSPVQMLGLLHAPESWRPPGSQRPRAVKPHLYNVAAVSAGMLRGSFLLAIKFTSRHAGHSERSSFHFKSFKNQKLCTQGGLVICFTMLLPPSVFTQSMSRYDYYNPGEPKVLTLSKLEI